MKTHAISKEAFNAIKNRCEPFRATQNYVEGANYFGIECWEDTREPVDSDSGKFLYLVIRFEVSPATNYRRLLVHTNIGSKTNIDLTGGGGWVLRESFDVGNI